MPRHLADDDVVLLAAKNSHQTQLFLFAGHHIPGEPDAVRRTEVGQTEVCRQLLAGENVFAIGGPIFGHSVTVVEGVNHQLAFNFDRFMLFVIKINAAGDPTRRLAARLVQNCVGPKTDNPAWSLDYGAITFVLENVKSVFRHKSAQALGIGRRTKSDQHDRGETSRTET